METLYSRGDVRHRFAGRFISTEVFRVESGIRQGCSASVLGFNAFLLPLCHQLQQVDGQIKAVVYVDDISIAAPTEQLLHDAATLAEKYLEEIGINLNPGKTQLWISHPLEHEVSLKKQVKPSTKVTVLGSGFCPRHVAQDGAH